MLSQIQARSPFVTFVAFCKISSVFVSVRLSSSKPSVLIHPSQPIPDLVLVPGVNETDKQENYTKNHEADYPVKEL